MNFFPILFFIADKINMNIPILKFFLKKLFYSNNFNIHQFNLIKVISNIRSILSYNNTIINFNIKFIVFIIINLYFQHPSFDCKMVHLEDILDQIKMKIDRNRRDDDENIKKLIKRNDFNLRSSVIMKYINHKTFNCCYLNFNAILKSIGLSNIDLIQFLISKLLCCRLFNFKESSHYDCIMEVLVEADSPLYLMKYIMKRLFRHPSFDIRYINIPNICLFL